MIDYATSDRKKFIYSFKRREWIKEATEITLVGIGLALIIFAGFVK